MKRTTTGFLALTMLAVSTTLGNAATIPYSTGFAVSGGSIPVLLPMFDPGLGTLLGVEFHFGGFGEMGVDVLNPTLFVFGSPGSVDAIVFVDFLAPTIGFGDATGVFPIGIPPLPPGVGGTFIGGAPIAGGTGMFAPSLDYIGAGMVDILVAPGGLILGGILPFPTIIVGETPPSAYGDLTIVYTYEEASAAVPEPTSLALWSGLGMMGLIAARRRRKQVA